MPWAEAAGHLGSLSIQRLAQLKCYWRLSMRAILKRAQDAGRISERQARRLWIQFSKAGTNEPVEIPQERAGALRALVAKHLEELGYSARDMARVLHEEVDEFRSDFGLVGTPLRLVNG